MSSNEDISFGDMNEEELRKAIQKHLDDAGNNQLGIDYSASPIFENVARYTPALSDGYIKTVERLAAQQAKVKVDGKSAKNPFKGYPFDAEDLKFINPKSRLCFYPWVLFSGGQGAKTARAAKEKNWITDPIGRDERVVVFGDSGGFQIQEQTIPFDPATTPKRMLKWLEKIADQSMVLDFPTGGISTGAMVPHVARLKRALVPVAKEAQRIGFSEGYMACVLQTEKNNEYFLKHRSPGSTCLLNVIQGRNEAESSFWYDRMRVFNQDGDHPFEGWAFAGKHSVQLSMTLRRLIQMRDDGLLRTDQYIHFLGVSTLKVGAALTFIQRALRKYTDAKDVQLTFDSKSPVDSMANGYQAITGYDFSRAKWSIHTERTNLPENVNSKIPLCQMAREWIFAGDNRHPARSRLGNILTLKDLVAPRDTATGKSIPSALQQTLLVHHNTQALIEAFHQAYQLLEPKHIADRPPSVAWLDEIVQLVFRTEAPMTLIAELEAKSPEQTDLIADLRSMPCRPMDVINECEAELDALSHEGYFGK